MGKAPLFSERKRAALAWTEGSLELRILTCPARPTGGHEATSPKKELADLTLAIPALNGWNKLSIALCKVAGSYQPSVR